MKMVNRLIGNSVLAGALALSLTGCVVYDDSPRRTVYVEPTPLPPPPPAIVETPVETSVAIRAEADFYEPLSPYGEWVVVGSYGRCWRPARVEAGWRPYANGYWQRTDAGWYWASDEPWGWATYHYGRWDWNGRYGWIWVPQTQWSPAWVSWREGAGYVGWAPLPPVASGGVEVREAVIAPRFVFVEERHMLEPVRPKTVIVNNTTVINQTVNITQVKVVNQTTVIEGPRAEVIEHASGRRVTAVPVHELRRKEEAAVVAHRRNAPADAPRNIQPAARTETQSVHENLPHNSRDVEQQAEVSNQQHPAPASGPIRGKGDQRPAATVDHPTPAPGPVRGASGQHPAATPERPQVQPQPHHDKTPEVAAAAVRQESSPALKPATVAPETERAAARPAVTVHEEPASATRSHGREAKEQTPPPPTLPAPPVRSAHVDTAPAPAAQPARVEADAHPKSPKDTAAPRAKQNPAKSEEHPDKSDKPDKLEKPVTPLPSQGQ